MNDEYDPWPVQPQACLSVHVGSWCAPGPNNLASNCLYMFFHHEKESDASRSKTQAHTLDGIILGRSPTSNAILVYNPRNQRYYEPDS